MILAKNLKKNFTNLPVLHGVDLEVKKAEIISITGRSGAGKTTLLQLLGTLDRPSNPEAELWIDGQNVYKLKDKALSEFRNQNIGFIFQFHELLPEFTALENICIPGFIAGRKQKEVEKRAMELLDFLHLKDRAQHKPDALSGGEQQRISVARALINKPKVVLADEPSGNLDSQNAQELHQLFFDLREAFGQTFVIITHNETLAKSCDRKIIMHDGRIVE
ncbi:MAG: lipoprotein-releasing system ATP-binding protein LolD [Flavobacteriaceae bacterium]|nr:MAG: lipoprotein-releasing system ATP-binding protein LolD [Flavobacteriaceae bacterium]